MAYSSVPGDSFLRRAMNKSELSRFQADELQMDDKFSKDCGEVTDRVVRFLQRDVPLNVDKTIKGGSLGKGTAIRGSCDLDAVVFLRDFRDMDDFNRKKRDVFQRIAEDLKLTDYYRRGEIKDSIRITAFFVNFDLKVNNQWISVDLLPAFDNIGHKGKENVYREMGRLSEWDRNPYSSSLVQLQLDFVKERPPAVKNLIRLVKYWNKTCIPETEGRGWLPSSYPLELITIGVWQKNYSLQSFDLRKGLKAVLQQINDYQHMDFSWTTNYSSYMHGMLTKEMGKAFVLDPANPYQNVAGNCRWDEVAKHARVAMEMPLLRDISCQSWQ